MTKKYSTKRALVASLLVLALCFTSFLATTFAWFTDSVVSENNIIQTGRLDVEMYWADGTEDPTAATWEDASEGAIFNNDNWEPGYTEVRHIKIANEGTLALKYKVIIVANGEVTNLADVIDVYYIDPAVQVATRDALANAPKLGTLTEVLAALGETGSGYLAKGDNDTITIALKMQESAGNEYQNTALCDGGFSIQLLATQAAGESDSFGDDYDQIAAADFFPGFQGGSANITVALNDAGLTAGKSVIDTGDAAAIIPTGVKLADGKDSLELTVTVKTSTESNILLGENEKMRPVDVHIEGVAEDNTTPMLVILENYMTTGINTGALKLYHVENGVTVPMTQVATPVNHNEFSYDPLTGDVTLALASFSEIALVADTDNTWNGETETAYTGSGTEADPYLIANADNLAYFRTQVDNGEDFEDDFVKLANNIYLSGKLFDPIGWGYVNKEWNSGKAEGNVFQGTFDGNNKTIYDLYQSGWDLEENTKTDYTYTNCGFGLFAAASNATFKDLTINGAYVRAECVEMGVLVGLSQDSCTYENIEIHNSKIANYQRPAGGLIGEVSGKGTTTITDVTIGSDVVVGSLWGDFDAPVGGVIGARWDDVGANPLITMTNVEVGARLDVYNDITSAYQWHAYRRAGMLIGNTELTDATDKHKAAAPFLTCTNVKVYYGDWVNYTYCSFSNHNERYPWVRTQAGENCEAFSNPRWGVPNDAEGNRVTDMNHKHADADADKCNISRPFGQLYGGGQGVYGKDTHPGVEIINYKYSITYINDGQVLDIIYVTNNTAAKDVDNDQAQKLVLAWAEDNIEGGTIAFGGWMNAASIKLAEIPANNTKNVVLYPYFNSPYTATFVDQQGNILAWCLFNNSDVSRLTDAFAKAKNNLPELEKDYELIHWKVSGTNLNNGTVKAELAKDNTNWESFKGYKDVTITPQYRYNGADLIAVVDELTGEVTHYEVAGYTGGVGSVIVEIPAYVNGKPVTTVNADAFSSYNDLHSIRIPGTITGIDYQSFTADDPDQRGEQRDTVTLYYEGDPAVWNQAMEDYNARNFNDNSLLKSGWDNMMGEGSCVFFLDENGNVDLSKGYWELAKTGGIFGIGAKFVWQFHNHIYSNNSGCDNEHNNKTVYTNDCSCDIGTHARPDAEYWTKDENN